MQRRSHRESTGRSGHAQGPERAIHRSKWRWWPPSSLVSIPRWRIAGWNVGGCLLVPSKTYTGEFPFEVTTFKAYNLKNFVSTAFSPQQDNGSTVNPEVFCEEI